MSTYRDQPPRIEDAPTAAPMLDVPLEGETLAYYDDVSARIFTGLCVQHGTVYATAHAKLADEAAVEMVIQRQHRRTQGIFVPAHLASTT